MIPVVVPAYAPPVSYFTWLLQQGTIYWVTDSHYHKQTYRNRTYIYGANGRLTLTIPIVHKREQSHQKESEVQTDVHSHWQQLHWRSLQAAYRSSPFFEFYEDAFAPLYQETAHTLYQFNRRFLDVLFDALDLDIPQEEVALDFTKHQLQESLLNAKQTHPVFPHYTQVFESKYGFLSNLSSLDLLFNKGPEARAYLDHCQG
ncbi:MAG: hypothetical protein HN591_06995 [Flavobacteriales bacterium]|jgi:hypothetical protein|nr:hypothetical protein [Flavobacteriales bacterium]